VGGRIDFDFTDLGETWTTWIRHGVLNARRGAGKDPALTVTGPKAAMVAAILRPGSAARLVEAGQITLDGDRAQLETYAALLDEFDPNFPIATP
jgi:linear primary-alkylsulfatase